METTSPTLLDQRFGALRQAGRKALVCYVTAGYPTPDKSFQLLKALEDSGADVLEIGVPFSDPIADGPVIQASSHRALEQGMNLRRTLDLVRGARLSVPVVLFTYLNPLLSAGDSVLSDAKAAGVDGVLVTDLPVGADPAREAWLGSSGLAFIRLVAPTTPLERMREITRNGSGFVYLIGRLGVTGAGAHSLPELRQTVGLLRSTTELPVCVGFGVTSENARAVAEIADGVVVGSVLVSAAADGVEAAAGLAAGIRSALDGNQ